MKQVCEIAASELIRTYKLTVSLVLNVLSAEKEKEKRTFK